MRVLALALLAGMMTGCARDQALVSIAIQPQKQEFLTADPSASVQLRALGTYIHPPVTKDITAQATWSSNSPDIATVSTTGLLAPGGFACGNALVTATVLTNSNPDRTSKGAIVTGSMQVTVDCP